MALDNIQRKDSLSPDELAPLEARLQEEGYRLVPKKQDFELFPGEYLKRERSSFVYGYGSPVVWEVVWCKLSGQRPQADASAVAIGDGGEPRRPLVIGDAKVPPAPGRARVPRRARPA